MLRLTLTQMRLNAGRLAAAGIAVVLGTAFVAATLLAGDLLKATMYEAVSVSYRGADVVVTEADTPASLLTAVRRLPQVDGADLSRETMVELMSGERSDTPMIGSLADTPALRTAKTTTGRLPSKSGELALEPALAERLRLSVGDQATARTQTWDPGTTDGSGTSDGRPVVHDQRVTVVGLLAPTKGFGSSPQAVALPADLIRWGHEQGGGGNDNVSRLVAHAAPGVSAEQARDAVASLPGWREAKIRTGEQQTQIDTRSLTRDVDFLTAGLLAFAALALFVAGLVITNTFQVLVAQRTRTLALLRCTGATRRQIRRGVLLEAAVLGGATSLLGLVTGLALVAGTAAVLSRMDLLISVPGSVHPSPISAVAPLTVGILVTILAALSPARAATRVSPVAALRPASAPDLRTRAGVVRIVLAVLLLVAGVGLLALGVTLTAGNRYGTDGVFPAIGGGVLSFLGILIGGSIFIPPLVGLIGRLAGRWGGVPARIATANAVRNPRRTANTSAALLIGVTLVATMSTGAAVLRTTLDHALDTRFPVDVLVGFEPNGWSTESLPPSTPVPAAVAPAVAKAPGVADVVPLAGSQAILTGASGKPKLTPDRSPASDDPAADPAAEAAAQADVAAAEADLAAAVAAGKARVSVHAVDPARARAALRTGSGAAGLAAGSAIVPASLAERLGIRAGDNLRLAVEGKSVQVRAAVTDLRWEAVLVTPGDLRTIAPKTEITMLWVRLDPTANPGSTVKGIQETIVTANESQDFVPVAGVEVERKAYEDVIGTLLLIVTALLGVAVVIALIGVANTLSLSVIERTRESAVLRALGLTRRQLRAMLAVEGALIVGIGALVGIGLGVLYGWAGAASVIGGAFRPSLAIPIGELALLLAGGVLAGLAASALPGRRAARTAPVAALAE